MAKGRPRGTRRPSADRRTRISRTASLKTLRTKIDRIDEQLLNWLNRRAERAIAVGQHKRREGRRLYAPEREHRILERLARRNGGPLKPAHVRTIFREVISSCLALEQPLRVAYLGPAGTYSQEAARYQFGSAAVQLPFASIDAVFDEIERGRVDYGVVPVENSTEGVVAQTLDRFVTSSLTIKTELLIQIDHCLLASQTRPKGLRRIVSHPQSLAQCRAWLTRHYPGVPLEEVASNAIAAGAAARSAGTAAIAGRSAAERYGLHVVAASIQDLARNATRFLVISRDELNGPTGDDKTSVLFGLRHESGALYRILEVFARERLNLSTIESRPLKGRAWEYIFFVDVAGHVDAPTMARALRTLRRRSLFVKVLGSYPAWRWPDEDTPRETKRNPGK